VGFASTEGAGEVVVLLALLALCTKLKRTTIAQKPLFLIVKTHLTATAALAELFERPLEVLFLLEVVGSTKDLLAIVRLVPSYIRLSGDKFRSLKKRINKNKILY
jgi:hypothetical protein